MAPSCAIFVIQKQEVELMAQGKDKEVHKEVGVYEVVLCYNNNLEKT